MDSLNRWFNDQLATPAGSLVMFLLMAVLRLGLEFATRPRKPKHRKRPPAAPSAG